MAPDGCRVMSCSVTTRISLLGDVDLARGLIVLRGETTKSKRSRVVPISTERLRSVITWLKVDADGDLKSEQTPLFSNEVGEPYRLFHHSWVMTVLKAHGVTPTWSATLNDKGSSEESQEAFRKINLRWHALRHEYASRLVEQGVPLAKVRDLLGHASITTTERYDNQKLSNLRLAAAKLDRGLMFEPSPFVGRLTSSGLAKTPASPAGSGSPAGTKSQDSFKIDGVEGAPGAPDEVLRAEASSLTGLDLGNWLGVRDDFRNWLISAA